MVRLKDIASFKKLQTSQDSRLLRLLAGLMVLVLFDAITRVAPLAKTTLSDYALEPVAVASLVRLSGETLRQYELQLSSFDVQPVIQSSGEQSDEASELRNQNSAYLQSDNAKYRLVAVLKGVEKVALVEKVEVASSYREILKVGEGARFAEFIVERIEPYSLTLGRADGDLVVLRIFERASLNTLSDKKS